VEPIGASQAVNTGFEVRGLWGSAIAAAWSQGVRDLFPETVSEIYAKYTRHLFTLLETFI
jgi:hypothetical protein